MGVMFLGDLDPEIETYALPKLPAYIDSEKVEDNNYHLGLIKKINHSFKQKEKKAFIFIGQLNAIPLF